MAVLSRRLGRTHAALRVRAGKLGIGAPSQGTLTMAELCRQTGYCEKRLRCAASRLGLRLRRVANLRGSPCRAGRYAVTEEQRDALLAYLATVPDGRHLRRPDGKRSLKGEWGTARKPAACAGCASAERPHHARGRCCRCYYAWKRRGRSSEAPVQAPPPPSEADACRTCQRRRGEVRWGSCGLCSRCYQRARLAGERTVSVRGGRARWGQAPWPIACLGCERTCVKPSARGRCAPCYQRARREKQRAA